MDYFFVARLLVQPGGLPQYALRKAPFCPSGQIRRFFFEWYKRENDRTDFDDFCGSYACFLCNNLFPVKDGICSLGRNCFIRSDFEVAPENHSGNDFDALLEKKSQIPIAGLRIF